MKESKLTRIDFELILIFLFRPIIDPSFNFEVILPFAYKRLFNSSIQKKVDLVK